MAPEAEPETGWAKLFLLFLALSGGKIHPKSIVSNLVNSHSTKASYFSTKKKKKKIKSQQKHFQVFTLWDDMLLEFSPILIIIVVLFSFNSWPCLNL